VVVLSQAKRPVLARRQRLRASTAWPDVPPMGRTALRVSLAIKLLGANALALAIFGSLIFAITASHLSVVIVVAAGFLALFVFGGLAALALLPLRGIEVVASRVWRGDFGARVGSSPMADRDMKRIGTTFNLLLDGLVADRTRLRALASAVIDAGDRERANLARELHDSTAQQLAALVLQLSAAARDAKEPELAERLESIREHAKATLEEVRLLSHTVHPRVLDDLGLAAALKKLGREVRDASGLEVEVTSTANGDVPPTSAAVLYRVAQAAVHNVVKHAQAHRLDLHLMNEGNDAVIEIVDDGRGFDVADAEQRRPGMGLYTMRERVALAGGEFDIHSTPGAGTRIRAAVPATDALNARNQEREDE
jgi:signal transduction histidine kinase